MLLLEEDDFFFRVGIKPSFTLRIFRYSYSVFLKVEFSTKVGVFSSMVFLSWSEKKGIFLRMIEFQWFLMLLSVLPGRNFEIYAHLLPFALCRRYKIHSSSWFQSYFLILGSKWLYQRSLHCFPWRSGMCLAILVQFFAPYSCTSSRMRSSSSRVHGFLIVLDLDVSE